MVSFLSLPDPSRVEPTRMMIPPSFTTLIDPFSSGTQDTLSYGELDFGLVLPDLYKNKK